MPPKAEAELVETMDHEALVKEVLKRLQKAVRKLAKGEDDEDKHNKKISGFAKPMKMSKELCEFLGVNSDTMMARTDVTKEINKYVKANNLQNPENKRELILDAKMKTILTIPSDVTLTFFNLQRYMSHHYIKEEGGSQPANEKTEKPLAEKSPDAAMKKIVKKVRPVVKA
jgi:chromatin remodeling complex protein RSC6